MMDRRRFAWSMGALAAGTALGGCSGGGDGTWTLEKVTGGSPFKGINGLAFDARGGLVAGSVLGQSVFSVDVQNGNTTTLVGPSTQASSPSGMADDIAFASNGDMFWTSLLLGQLQVRRANGTVATINSSLPGINSLAFHPDGRLFVSQCFLADGLWRVDPATGAATRIAENLDIAPPELGTAGLNGFQFGTDGLLYGPLWNKGEVVSIDVNTSPVTVRTVATGFGTPGAVNIDSRGNLWVIDVARGELVRVDAATRQKVVAVGAPSLKKGLDNLAIDAQDRIYVSNPSDNSIQVYEGYTAATGLSGSVRTVVTATLCTPAGMGIGQVGGRDTLFLADFFALRSIDANSGTVSDLGRPVADLLPYPTSVTVNNTNLVVSSWFAGTVQVIARAGGATRLLRNGFVTPHDALQLTDGSILVAELALGRLTRLSADGNTRSTLTDGLTAPVGLVQSGNAVFVSELGTGRVTRVDLASGSKSTLASGFVAPEGLALDAQGRLVVLDVGRRRAVIVDPANGVQIELIDVDLPVGLRSPAGPPSYIPNGVAGGSDGALYVSSDIDSAVYRLIKR